MTIEDLNNLLSLSKNVSERIEEFYNYKQKFMNEILQELEEKVDVKSLPREWWSYANKYNLLSGKRDFIENELNSLLKNYEKLTSNNF